MTSLYESFLLILATAGDCAMAHQVAYLKVENAILRRILPRRITVTAEERTRLLRFGKAMGSAIKDLIGIVTPRTFARWIQNESAPKHTPDAPTGRPRTTEEVRALILQLAQDTSWGYKRVLGELKKLGVKVSKSTIVNVLKEAGIDTGPQREQGNWAAFVKRQAATLWSCDFFSTKVWTLTGPVQVIVLFFLHIGSRRVHISGMTTRPDKAWVVQQAQEAALVLGSQAVKPTLLLRDMDGKYGPEFDAAFQEQGIGVLPVGPRMPNKNAHAERYVLTVKSECLSQFVVLGMKHLQYLLTEFNSYYHTERPHQGLNNRPLVATEDAPVMSPFGADEVVCHERLGGLLKHYQRRPAA